MKSTSSWSAPTLLSCTLVGGFARGERRVTFGGQPMGTKAGERWMVVRKVGDDDRSLDIAFWQAQGPDAIFRAAWELVETAYKLKGGDPRELRLQRSPVVVDRIGR